MNNSQLTAQQNFNYHFPHKQIPTHHMYLCHPMTPVYGFQVGIKGNPKGVNNGLDCDVIVAEVWNTDFSASLYSFSATKSFPQTFVNQYFVAFLAF